MTSSVPACYLAVLIGMFAGAFRCESQQVGSYSQYFFNLYDVNSAFAGNHQTLSAAMRYRRQWTGMNGAPASQYLSIHAPLYSSSFAGGLKIMHESIGARDVVEVKTSAVYKMKIAEARLSFALTGGILRQQMDAAQLYVKDPDDVLIAQGILISNTPVLDASVIYTTHRFFAGIESGRLTRTRMAWSETSRARLFSHIQAVAGWIKKIGPTDLLELSALVKMSEPGFYQAEGSAAYLFRDLIWLGVGYRSGAGIMAYTEWNINTRLRVGYSYDMMTNGLKGYQNGSHEIFLGFTLNSRNSNSIRYFH